MSLLDRITKQGKANWFRGKLIWFYAGVCFGTLFLMIGAIGLLGIIQTNILKWFGSGVVFIVIAYKLRKEKEHDI